MSDETTTMMMDLDVPAPAAVKPEPVRFSIPPEVRSFTLFAALPVEIRHQIWEEAVCGPSMNFLKIVVEPDSSRSSDSHSDSYTSNPGEEEQSGNLASGSTASPSHRLRSRIKFKKAHLSPIYPHPRADSSAYVELNQKMTTLSASCAEADRVVKRLLHHSTSLKLSDGRAVSLGHGAPDVVCLDYISVDRFYNGCRLRYDVDCPGLEQIRHVAVRYCHRWENQSELCPRCRRSHDAATQQSQPLHVYQFLARHLPNLETFYFIDYLILRNQSEDNKGGVAASPRSDSPVQDVPKKPAGFRSDGRTFHEVSAPRDNNWIVSTKVFQTLDWVRDNFRRYAVESTTTRFRHPCPRKVQFKVLACDWDIAKPPITPAAPLNQVTPKKGGNKRGYASVCSESPSAGRAFKTFKSRRQQSATPAAMDATSAIPFVTNPDTFVFGMGNKFDFVFRGKR